MTLSVQQKRHSILLIIAALLWAGMILGIAFDAVLKFEVSAITREIGLELGSFIFFIFNKVEIVIALLLLVSLLRFRGGFRAYPEVTAVAAILVVQSAWLVPALVERAAVIIAGGTPGPSYTHFIYVAFDFSKVVLLGLFSYRISWVGWSTVQKAPPA